MDGQRTCTPCPSPFNTSSIPSLPGWRASAALFLPVRVRAAVRWLRLTR